MGLIKFFSKARVYVATIFLLICLVSLIYGGFPLAVFLSVLIYFGQVELVNMLKAKGMNPPLALILFIDAILIICATLKQYNYVVPILAISTIVIFLVILFRGAKASINDIGASFLAILYGGFLPIHIIFLRDIKGPDILLFGRHFDLGIGYIVLMFVVISLCDIAAFYVGTKLGKTPLWPEISPKKTIEGSVGGTVVSVLGAVLIGHFIDLSLVHSIISGLLLSLAAQFGDLAESMIKRDAGFKDSGNLLPGHGGMLDRADSYVFTGAIAYYYFSIFVNNGSLLSTFMPF
ncbi:MAG: phosphatidate cytidylyltransferase [bacterium]